MSKPKIVEGEVRKHPPEGTVIVTDDKLRWRPEELFSRLLGKRVRVTIETDLPVHVTMEIPKCSYCGKQLIVRFGLVCPTKECQHNVENEKWWKGVRVGGALKYLKDELNGSETESLSKVSAALGIDLSKITGA